LARPRGKRSLYQYLKELRDRAAGCDAILCCYAFGSIARNNFHDASDLDMVLVRKPGMVNTCRAFKFVLVEKIHALLHKLPIALWVGDSMNLLDRYRADEVPVVIVNENNVLATYYERTQTIEEAIIANGDAHLFEDELRVKEEKA